MASAGTYAQCAHLCSMLAANLTCGHCYYCMGGFPYYICEHLEDYGKSLSCPRPSHLFGGWAEYMYILAGTLLFRVPDDLPSHIGALNEVMDYEASGLEVLRQPLEDGHVAISRAQGSVSFPAKFMLVGAVSPCPCGYHGDPTRECGSSPARRTSELPLV